MKAVAKPCTLGAKHKWQWVQDVTLRNEKMFSIRISLRGLYRCECGGKRSGQSKGGL